VSGKRYKKAESEPRTLNLLLMELDDYGREKEGRGF
jgi:hypothetical protein